MSPLCLQLYSCTRLQRAKNRGFKIQAAIFFQETPDASTSLYPREVISSWLLPCPSRRQGNRGPETGGSLAQAPLIREQQAQAKPPPPTPHLSFSSVPSPLAWLGQLIYSFLVVERRKKPTCHLCDINISGKSWKTLCHTYFLNTTVNHTCPSARFHPLGRGRGTWGGMGWGDSVELQHPQSHLKTPCWGFCLFI